LPDFFETKIPIIKKIRKKESISTQSSVANSICKI